MSWKCKDCGSLNVDREWPTCRNPNCKSHDYNRPSERWWKCQCGHYNYENVRYCGNCKKDRDDSAIRFGG